MHRQTAFLGNDCVEEEYPVTNRICESVLSLPFHSYMKREEAEMVVDKVVGYLKG